MIARGVEHVVLDGVDVLADVEREHGHHRVLDRVEGGVRYVGVVPKLQSVDAAVQLDTQHAEDVQREDDERHKRGRGADAQPRGAEELLGHGEKGQEPQRGQRACHLREPLVADLDEGVEVAEEEQHQRAADEGHVDLVPLEHDEARRAEEHQEELDAMHCEEDAARRVTQHVAQQRVVADAGETASTAAAADAAADAADAAAAATAAAAAAAARLRPPPPLLLDKGAVAEADLDAGDDLRQMEEEEQQREQLRPAAPLPRVDARAFDVAAAAAAHRLDGFQRHREHGQSALGAQQEGRRRGRRLEALLVGARRPLGPPIGDDVKEVPEAEDGRAPRRAGAHVEVLERAALERCGGGAEAAALDQPCRCLRHRAPPTTRSALAGAPAARAAVAVAAAGRPVGVIVAVGGCVGRGGERVDLVPLGGLGG